MITVHEKAQRNSGIIGGKFLERTRVCKPGSSIDTPEFYTPSDFSIGAVIEIFKHRFKITDADEYVLKYLESFPSKFPLSTINSIKARHDKEPLDVVNDEKNQPVDNTIQNNVKHTEVKTENKWR